MATKVTQVSLNCHEHPNAFGPHPRRLLPALRPLFASFFSSFSLFAFRIIFDELTELFDELCGKRDGGETTQIARLAGSLVFSSLNSADHVMFRLSEDSVLNYEVLIFHLEDQLFQL